MAIHPLLDPKEQVEPTAGRGGYGADFSPRDKDFVEIRAKARQVLDGSARYTYDELCKLIAKLLLAR